MPSKLGFPAPLLAEVAMRLQVYAYGEGWIAVEKPAGVLIDPPQGQPDSRCLTAAIRDQLRQEKPEMQRLQAECVRSVFPLDAEIAGCALLALTPSAVTDLRNAFGSHQLRFRLGMVSSTSPSSGEDQLRCEVPVAQNSQTGATFLSAARGKRACTDFVRVSQAGRFTVWSALTDYLRPEQVRLHAAEMGIAVLGDLAHQGAATPTAAQLHQRRFWKGEDTVYYAAPMIWLEEVECVVAGGVRGLTRIGLPRPRGVEVFLKKARLEGS